jgi:hypothetical protein
MTDKITFCEGCNKEIDPEVCHCGDLMIDHIAYEGHYPVPMGCICGYISLSDNFNFSFDESWKHILYL